jgi:undecaprenyl-diphosphatase
MDFLNFLLPTIEHFSMLGYWLVFLLAFAESLAFIGLFVPGSVAVIFAGFLAAQGVLDIGDLFWFAAVGAILGDGLSYYLGRRGAISFRPENRIFKPELLEKGENFFKKHGAASVCWGRFVGWVRPVIPFVAGLFKLNRKTFFFYNILSGILWAAVHISVGYFFGQTWQVIMVWSSRLGVLVAAILGFFIVFYGLKWLIVKKGRMFYALLISVLSSIRQAVLANPDVCKFVNNHSRFFRFAKGRLNKNKFSGLPLTLLVVAFTYVLSLLLGIIEDVITFDPITQLDTRVVNLLFAFRSSELTDIFLWITMLGKWQVICVKALIVSILLWLWSKRVYILPFWLSLLGTEIFVWLGKLAFHRSRPEVAIYAEHSFSFPSGHAAIAVAFYGFIIYVLWRSLHGWKSKINILFAGLTVILAIGSSRLYLGVHFLSDVWGGYLVGVLWVIVAVSITEWLIKRNGDKLAVEPLHPKSLKLTSLALICITVLLYIGLTVKYHPLLKAVPVGQDRIMVLNRMDIFNNRKLPKYTETPTGKRQEPLNFVIVAHDDQRLVAVFRQAGWLLADEVSLGSVAKLAKAAILEGNYPTAPMTPSFWNAGVHDFGFEKPTTVNNVRERHHARFWKTDFETKDGKQIYVGTVSLDVGLKWGITHKIKPDIDTERELLFDDLYNVGAIFKFQKEQFVDPTLGWNFSGDPFFTDGKIYFIEF